MEVDLNEVLSLALQLGDEVLEDESAQQVAENLRGLQGMAKKATEKAKDTARSFRQAADTLDYLWKASNKGHAFGTSIGIVGGLLTLGGGIATIMSAGAASPLLLLGMGAGFTGAGINGVSSYIEASMNSTSIQKAEKDWMETLKCINNVKSTVQSLQSQESTMLLFKLLAERHLKLEFARRFTPSVVIGCTALVHSAGKTGAQAVAKAGTQAADKAAKAVAKAAAQAVDDVAQTAAKIGAQTADDVAQAVAKVAAQATDDVGQVAVKASAQAADDIAQAGVKAGSNAGKVAGGVIIGVSAVFLVWDVFDLHFTIRDLVKKKGSDAAKALRAKADELDKICSSC